MILTIFFKYVISVHMYEIYLLLDVFYNKNKITFCTVTNSTHPVSYTHLDVYKRQANHIIEKNLKYISYNNLEKTTNQIRESNTNNQR